MKFFKTNTTVSLGILTSVLLIAAVCGAPFAGFATIISFLVLCVALTHSKSDVSAYAQKFGAFMGAVVRRHRVLVILIGVYFLASIVKESGIQELAVLALAAKFLVPWKRISRSMGLEASSKSESTQKVDA